jgi:hypothetical protein
VSTTQVDPWMAGKAQYAQAKSTAAVAKIQAKTGAKDRAAQRRENRRNNRKAEAIERAGKRAARWKAIRAWVKANWHHALWLPVIVAPGVLAWTAQQGAGDSIFGSGMGWLLALFTETSAWALLAHSAIRRARGDSAGAITAAVWLVAMVGAVLNYVHGASDPGASWHGLVMALVSVSGIAVHQIAHARVDLVARVRGWLAGRMGRRVTRDQARIGRVAHRRRVRFELAAARSATAVLYADGRVELRYRTGPVTLSRFRRLIEATPVNLADQVAAMVEHTAQVSGWHPEVIDTEEVPAPINQGEHDSVTDLDLDLLTETRNLINQGKLSDSPTGNQIYVHVMGRQGDKARACRVRDMLAKPQLHAVDADADGAA